MGLPPGANLAPGRNAKTSMATFFSVRNFDRFQHYRDRTPPWIKLYNVLLENYEFGCLPDAAKGQLIGIWLLASRLDNRLPHNPAWIARKINATDTVDLDLLERAGFIEIQSPEQDASNMLPAPTPDAPVTGATCSGKCDLERETEGEREKETEGESRGARKRGIRLPADWNLSTDLADIAADARRRHGLPPIDLQLEAEKFRLYWHSKAGLAATKINWEQTFLNWALKATGARQGKVTDYDFEAAIAGATGGLE